jgi:fumarate hydratase class I
MQDITEHLVELVRSTSTDLSPDVEGALSDACRREEPNSAAQGALQTILENIRLSRRTGRPICQDTGTPIFYFWHPEGMSQRRTRRQTLDAVRIATERAYLRPNAVEALTGKNTGDNTGVDFPTTHFEEWEHDYLKVGLML